MIVCKCHKRNAVILLEEKRQRRHLEKTINYICSSTLLQFWDSRHFANTSMSNKVLFPKVSLGFGKRKWPFSTKMPNFNSKNDWKCIHATLIQETFCTKKSRIYQTKYSKVFFLSLRALFTDYNAQINNFYCILSVHVGNLLDVHAQDIVKVKCLRAIVWI